MQRNKVRVKKKRLERYRMLKGQKVMTRTNCTDKGYSLHKLRMFYLKIKKKIKTPCYSSEIDNV